MANQPNQQPLEIVFSSGETKEVANGFLTELRLIARKGQTPQSNKQVRLKEGNNFIADVYTDATGEATYDYIQIPERAGCSYEVRALCMGQERKTVITLPELKKKKAKDNDPKEMKLSRSHDNNGNYHIFARVIGNNGRALKNITVTFRVDNVKTDVKTDATGYAEIDVNRPLNPGEELMVYATVSGIAEEAKIKLRRSPNWPVRFTSEWFGSIFGIAAIVRWALYLFWIIMLVVIMNTDYQPVLLKNPTELSKQQELFNQRSRPDQKIVLKENGKEFPGGIIFVMLGVTAVVFIGTAIVHRRRVVFAFTTVWDRISAKWENHAIDPMSERVLNWMKVLNVAKRDKNSDGVIDEKDKDTNNGPGEGHHKAMFLKMFGSDMLSELVTGALILLLKGGKFSKYA